MLFGVLLLVVGVCCYFATCWYLFLLVCCFVFGLLDYYVAFVVWVICLCFGLFCLFVCFVLGDSIAVVDCYCILVWLGFVTLLVLVIVLQ